MKKTVFDIVAYVMVFLAIQSGVYYSVLELWRVCSGKSDISSLKLTVCMTVFSLLTIGVFWAARWFRGSRRYLQSRPWFTAFWCGIGCRNSYPHCPIGRRMLWERYLPTSIAIWQWACWSR